MDLEQPDYAPGRSVAEGLVNDPDVTGQAIVYKGRIGRKNLIEAVFVY